MRKRRMTMSKKDSIEYILASLREMLNELSTDQVYQVEDFIVNQCDESYEDSNGNTPNFFTMTVLDTK
jgi:hypothetical protein